MSLLISGGSLPPSDDLYLNKGQNSPLFASFKGFIRKEKLFSHRDSILVAVSGGPDSLCLLNLLILLSEAWSLRLAVAHFDHGLRGQESRRDRDFVRQVCKVNSLPFFFEYADVGAEAKEKKKGIQDIARQLRYAFFKQIAQTNGLRFIATGHTCDDQAEEILFRLIRGAGPEGLSGIRLKRADNVIRPLLFCKKADILAHLAQYQIPFVSDSSNLQTKYTRNKIRRLIMPLIEKQINPSATNAIYKAGRLLAQDSRALESIADAAYEKCLTKKQNVPGIALDRSLLLELPEAIRKRVFKRAMEQAGIRPWKIRYDHLEKASEISLSTKPSSFYLLPEKFMLLRNYNTICIVKKTFEYIWKTKDRNHFCLIAASPGSFELPKGAGKILLKKADCATITEAFQADVPHPLFIDLDQADFPFTITFRKDGDRFQPIGQRHEGKLKKFLISRRIPRFSRDFLPILRKGDKIIAVCGLEISQQAVITGKSKRCLKIVWEPEEWLTNLNSLKNPH